MSPAIIESNFSLGFPEGVTNSILHPVFSVIALETILLPQSAVNHEKFTYHERFIFSVLSSVFLSPQPAKAATILRQIIDTIIFFTFTIKLLLRNPNATSIRFHNSSVTISKSGFACFFLVISIKPNFVMSMTLHNVKSADMHCLI